MMLEETGVCPYVERCEDVRVFRRVEDRLLQERRGFFSMYAETKRDDYVEAVDEYRRRLEGVGRAMGRCRGSYRRCLRYWQLLRRDENAEVVPVPVKGVAEVVGRPDLAG